jgi:SAM-dependent methyltransferase
LSTDRRGASTLPELPRENVFGHTKKARLVLAALARLRHQRQRGLDVLDIGCGNGTALTRFLACPGDTVVGIDRHEPSIAYARSHFGAPGMEFHASNLEWLVAEGRRFDAVVLADVLEHVPDPQHLLTSAVQLVREGGRVLVTVPNGFGPFEIESWLSRLPVFGPASLWAVDHFVAVLNRFVFKDAWTAVVSPSDVPYNAECGHVQFFTPGALLRMAAGAGIRSGKPTGLSWLSGPYTNFLFAPSRPFCAFNTWIAERLPLWLVSGWFFEFFRDPVS